jgi:hypothetical protein
LTWHLREQYFVCLPDSGVSHPFREHVLISISGSTN